MGYVLHYAPDNASLIVRMTLDAIEVPFETVLVDRQQNQQKSAPFLKMNPVGRIPVLETPDGVLSETGAILLWLTERHQTLAPMPGDASRCNYLRWLFFCSNSLHATLRLLFYPEQTVPSAHADAIQRGAARQITDYLAVLNKAAGDVFGASQVQALDFYIAACLRWIALYGPSDRKWFRLNDYDALAGLAARVEAHPATAKLCAAEGLGPYPFTAPQRPTPPEGSVF